MTMPSTIDAREASRELTGRFGAQPHAESGVVEPGLDVAGQPGQRGFGLAIHQAEVIAVVAASLGADKQSRLDASVDVLAALASPGDPDARRTVRGRIGELVQGPVWGVASGLRQSIGSMSRGSGDRSSQEMTEATRWLTAQALQRVDDEEYRRTVADQMWRLTHPTCKAGKRRRHAQAVDWALANSRTTDQALALIGMRCNGLAA